MAVRKEKDKSTWYVQTSFVNYMGDRKRTTKGDSVQREMLWSGKKSLKARWDNL